MNSLPILRVRAVLILDALILLFTVIVFLATAAGAEGALHRWWTCILALGAFFTVRASLGHSLAERHHDPLGRVIDRVRSLLTAPVSRSIRIALGLLVLASVISKLQVVSVPGFMAGDDSEVHSFTFSWLFHNRYTAWDLRSPLYPYVFIYPAQLMARLLVPDNIDALIIAGRLVVLLFSIANLALTYRVGRLLSGHAGFAFVAAFLLATNQTHNMFGGTELPRTVSSTFVLLAFLATQKGRAPQDMIQAGLWLALAQCLRFSEGIFVVPALAVALLERQWRAAFALCVAFVAGVLVIQSTVDFFYWGHPLYSLINIIRYTVVERASSRGFQPFPEYANTIQTWSSYPVVLLAVAAVRVRRPLLGLWTWVPILMLSCLPHKEPRYLIPSLPFIALSATDGLRWVLDWCASRKRVVLAAFVVLSSAIGVGHQIGRRLDLGRYGAWVPVARYLEHQGPLGGVAFEDFLVWSGASLYLRNAEKVVQLDWTKLSDEGTRERLSEPDLEWVAVRWDHLRPWLLGNGYEEVILPANADPNVFRLYRRTSTPQPHAP